MPLVLLNTIFLMFHTLRAQAKSCRILCTVAGLSGQSSGQSSGRVVNAPSLKSVLRGPCHSNAVSLVLAHPRTQALSPTRREGKRAWVRGWFFQELTTHHGILSAKCSFGQTTYIQHIQKGTAVEAKNLFYSRSAAVGGSTGWKSSVGRGGGGAWTVVGEGSRAASLEEPVPQDESSLA